MEIAIEGARISWALKSLASVVGSIWLLGWWVFIDMLVECGELENKWRAGHWRPAVGGGRIQKEEGF